eukprot:4157698-Pleurochrysis_carterae.AAC.5
MRAGEGSKTAERGLQSWSAQESSVLLCGCSQRAPRESNASACVSSVHVSHGGREPEWAVAGMQEDRRR